MQSRPFFVTPPRCPSRRTPRIGHVRAPRRSRDRGRKGKPAAPLKGRFLLVQKPLAPPDDAPKKEPSAAPNFSARPKEREISRKKKKGEPPLRTLEELVLSGRPRVYRMIDETNRIFVPVSPNFFFLLFRLFSFSSHQRRLRYTSPCVCACVRGRTSVPVYKEQSLSDKVGLD